MKIKDIKVDGQNLIITTTEPNADLLASLTEPAFVIVDTKDEKDMATAPVLTGPYKITKYTKGESIELTAFADYWGGKPGLDSITVKDIEDNNKRAMALQSKDVDLIQKVDSANRSLFEKGDFTIHEVAGVRTYILQLNVRPGNPLADPTTRKAVGYMIDYDAITKIAGNGAIAAGAPFPPTANMGVDSLPNKQHKDLAKADELMKQAGFTKNGQGMYEKNGKPLTLVLAIWGKDTSIYEEIQQELKQAGVAVEIKKVQGTEDLLSLAPNGFDMGETNWVTMSTNDPYWFVSLAYKSGAKSNRGDYKNAQVDALVDQLSSTFDENKRIEITKQIQNIVIDDNAGYNLFFPTATVVTTNKVKNVEVFPIDYYVVTKDLTIE